MFTAYARYCTYIVHIGHYSAHNLQYSAYAVHMLYSTHNIQYSTHAGHMQCTCSTVHIIYSTVHILICYPHQQCKYVIYTCPQVIMVLYTNFMCTDDVRRSFRSFERVYRIINAIWFDFDLIDVFLMQFNLLLLLTKKWWGCRKIF